MDSLNNSIFNENHMHIFMNGTDYRRAVHDIQSPLMESIVRRHLKIYKDCGITYLRDGGDHYQAGVLARKLAGEYGITYRTPCFGIHKNGHYGKIVGLGFDDMKEYHSLVKKAISEDADFIKIMISGIMNFDNGGGLSEVSLPGTEIREMIHIAHEEGMSVMAHTNGRDAVLAAVEGGVDSLEHGNFMDDECIAALAESDTVYIPTVSTIRNLIGDSRFPEDTMKKLWEGQKRVIGACFDSGVHLALGSDAGAYLVPHGQGIRDERDAFILAVCEGYDDERKIRRQNELLLRLKKGEEMIMNKF